MERCNRPAWRYYPNGFRACIEHARVNDERETLAENPIGLCDEPVDGLGAMSYHARLKLRGAIQKATGQASSEGAACKRCRRTDRGELLGGICGTCGDDLRMDAIAYEGPPR